MGKSVKKMKNRNEKRKIKKFGWKLLFGFIIFEIIFSAVTGPFLLLYGPFETAKNMFVGTAMGSMHYSWLATTFLSQAQIDKILNKDSEADENVSTEDSTTINVSKNHDDKIIHQLLDGSNFSGHALIVSDPSRIKIGYTSKLNNAKKEGEKTSTIAQNNGAVAAINGGAFTEESSNSQLWSSSGGKPSGVVISNGAVVYDDTNGLKQGTIAMTNQGILLTGTYTTKELKEKGVTDAVSFNTDILVTGGKAAKLQYHMAGSNPRTIIGQRQDGSIVLVALDSKNGNRLAATLEEAQDLMLKLKCEKAATLDGGKSTTMYFNDEVVNTPSYELGERYIPTAIIVK